MKTFTHLTAVVLAVFALTQPLHSQTARPVKSVRDQLQDMKAANQKLLEQQAATIKKLDEVTKEASQLRILVRRT
ncbi:MAG TPA: hypothetical protein VGO11_09620 [Chthoniobacteraceae bacterium]|jgi:hypothetical protein|nr:hypothetical protein [Chthoniobacteraceae bacterium]